MTPTEVLISSLPLHLRERTREIPRPASGRSRLAESQLSPLQASDRRPVVYWTHHAQRVEENPALDVACTLALTLRRPLVVYHGLSSQYRYASDRHHVFQIQGAKDLQEEYTQRGIRYAFELQRRTENSLGLLRLAQQTDLLITDDFPGEPTDRWLKRLAYLEGLTILAVDTACVVPMQLVGRGHDRAFAFRDATTKLYKERLSRRWPILENVPQRYDGHLPFEALDCSTIEPYQIVAQCDIDPMVPPVADTCGGSRAGYKRWNDFLKDRISKYAAKRNDPCAEYSSRMSAYLHYGMVSPMRLAREANERKAEKYLDELLIWRELAYGYCFYRSDYHSIETIPSWAIETLRKHQKDRREKLYSWETLARGKTDDRLWNACQESLIRHGELHNNLRMTWGKAILSWTQSPEEALGWIIDLNHRYALDGRDPASYGGILWCLGQFDRPFYPEQPVLGTVRARPTSGHSNRLDFDRYERIVRRPIAKSPCRVAVVGAGIAGLLCARSLADVGFEVELFEKSRGPGGRGATRRLNSAGTIDHGAPFFQITSRRWENLLASWEQDSVIARWEPRLGIWTGRSQAGMTAVNSGLAAGSIVAADSVSKDSVSKDSVAEGSLEACALERAPGRVGKWWVGKGGMNRIGKHLSQGLAIGYRKTIEGIERRGQGWTLWGNVQSESSVESFQAGPFDCVVLAIPSPQIPALVDPDCRWREVASSRTMEPTWTVMLEFASRWEIPFDAIHLEAHKSLLWMSRESSKPSSYSAGYSGDLQVNSRGLAGPEAWCIQATSRWTGEHLEEDPEWVKSELIGAISKLGFVAMPEILQVQAHRWRYGQSVSEGGRREDSRPYLWDPDLQLGACGDWVTAPGRTQEGDRIQAIRPQGIERALESGAAMAGGLYRHWVERNGLACDLSVGNKPYQPLLFDPDF